MTENDEGAQQKIEAAKAGARLIRKEYRNRSCAVTY